MRARSFEYNQILLQFVNKKPICLDVTFSASRVIPDKLVVSMKRIEFILLNQCTSKDLELLKISSALPHSLDISLELPGVDRNAH